MNERANSIAIGLLLVLSFAAGWSVNGWRADVRIAQLKLSQTSQELHQTQ